jgi:hypothetical protein
VRLYVIRHERDPEMGGEVAFFQTCSMRLNHPNDELGSGLLLCLPQVVVHEMDSASPLVPPAVWASATKMHRWRREDLKPRRRAGTSVDESVLMEPNGTPEGSPEQAPRFPEVTVRTPVRSPRKSRAGGPGAGVESESASILQSYQKRSVVDDAGLLADTRYVEEQKEISSYMQDRSLEVIAIVEGTDAATGK